MAVFIFIVIYLVMGLITGGLAAAFDNWAHGFLVDGIVYIVIGLLWPVGLGVVAGNFVFYLLTGR